MKISPIDIRKHTFEKGFRGYDIDEVDAFMNSLSQEWERVASENKTLRAQLEAAEKDLMRMKDIEKTLYLTLKTAEEASTKITSQASEEAELRLKESEEKSEEMINKAMITATKMVNDAETKAQSIKNDIANELRNQERDFKALEKYRDNLIVQLRTLVNNTGEIIERFDKKFSNESAQVKFVQIRQQLEQPREEVEADVIQPELEFGNAEVNEENTTIVEEEDIISQTTTSDAGIESMPEEKAEVIVEEDIVAAAEIETVSERETSKKDIADETMEEINRLKSNRSEEPVPTAPTEDAPVKKNTGSFFDQIG